MACLKVCDQSITLVGCKTTCNAPSLFNHIIGTDLNATNSSRDTLSICSNNPCSNYNGCILECLGSISPYNIQTVCWLSYRSRPTDDVQINCSRLSIDNSCELPTSLIRYLSWTMRRRPVEVSETARPWISQSLFFPHHSASTLYRFVVPHTLGA